MTRKSTGSLQLSRAADSYTSLPGIANRSSFPCPLVAFSPNGSTLAVAYESMKRKYKQRSGTIRISEILIWDVVKQAKLALCFEPTLVVWGLEFSPDGKALVCVGEDLKNRRGIIATWKTSTWKIVSKIRTDNRHCRIAFSPNGKRIASAPQAIYAPNQPKVSIHQFPGGKCVRQFFKETDGGISDLKFSPDGKLIAVATESRPTVSVWHAQSGRLKWEGQGHPEETRLDISPDGKTLVSSGERSIHLWDMETGKIRCSPERTDYSVNEICFSSDGSRFAAAAYMHLKIWDTATGQEQASIAWKPGKRNPSSFVRGLKFWPDDSTLTAVHYNGVLTRWNMDSTKWELHGDQSRVGADLRVAVAAKPLPARAQKLVASIVERPDLPSRKLKYADWLDKNGDPARAEFIRLQCRADEVEQLFSHRSKKVRQQLLSLHKKASKLLVENFSAWTTQLSSLNVTIDDVGFRGGLIHSVRLNSAEFDDDSLKVLAQIPELQSISLRGSNVTNDGLKQLKPLTNLRWIDASNTAIDPDGLKHLKSHKRLYRVYAFNWGNRPNSKLQSLMKIRNRAFEALTTARARRAEAINALGYILDGPKMYGDQDGRIESVSFSQSWATDADLIYLTAIPEVQRVDFFECNAVTSKGMQYLASLPKLKEVELVQCGVSDVKAMGKIASLESLRLGSLPNFDRASLKSLAKLKKLKRLVIDDCDLTDKEVQYIAKMDSLESLELRERHVTDAGYKLLAALPKLRELTLDDEKKRKKLIASIIG